MDTVVNAGAVAYGIVLVLGVFVRTSVTEAMRVQSQTFNVRRQAHEGSNLRRASA